MANPNVKPPCTFSKMTPEQRAECGRKGAEVTKRKVRERKAMKETLELYCTRAIITEIAMNITMRNLIVKTCCFSVMSFFTVTLRKSRVSVELEARTREESVDIDAERTRITTRAIRIDGSPESIAGIIAS